MEIPAIPDEMEVKMPARALLELISNVDAVVAIILEIPKSAIPMEMDVALLDLRDSAKALTTRMEEDLR